MKESQDEEERKRRDLEAKENEDNKDDEDDEEVDEEEHTQPDVSVDSMYLSLYFTLTRFYKILRLNLRMMCISFLISADEKNWNSSFLNITFQQMFSISV